MWYRGLGTARFYLSPPSFSAYPVMMMMVMMIMVVAAVVAVVVAVVVVVVMVGKAVIRFRVRWTVHPHTHT
jgi:membrane protein YdbS with pleckstrin-like domain